MDSGPVLKSPVLCCMDKKKLLVNCDGGRLHCVSLAEFTPQHSHILKLEPTMACVSTGTAVPSFQPRYRTRQPKNENMKKRLQNHGQRADQILSLFPPKQKRREKRSWHSFRHPKEQRQQKKEERGFYYPRTSHSLRSPWSQSKGV